MTNTEPITQDPFTASSDPEAGPRRATAARRVSRVITTIRSGVTTLAERAPGFARTTQTRASDVTTVLQHLPDSTLRWLAAGSIGVAAGFQLAGAPRLVTAAGAAPALMLGAAIALRQPDQHAKGASSSVAGTVEEGLGRLTGDKETEIRGRARQVKGSAQQGLGDVQDALKGYRGEDQDGA